MAVFLFVYEKNVTGTPGKPDNLHKTKTDKALLCPVLYDFRNNVTFLRVPRLRTFLLLEKQHVHEDENGALVE
jgi:hypothetical protein